MKRHSRGGRGRRPRRGPADDAGQALLEFALLLPLLLILVIGIVEFARLWMQYQVVTDAAREAARMAVIKDIDLNDAAARAARIEAIYDRITESLAVAGVDVSGASMDADHCSALPGGSASHVEIYGCNWVALRGNPASVSIRAPYRFQFLAPFIGWTTGNDAVTLTTSFVMRNE